MTASKRQSEGFLTEAFSSRRRWQHPFITKDANRHRSGNAPIQECEWKQGESAVGEVRKGRTHFQEVSSLNVHRASRWSAIGLIGDPRPKTVLDDGRLSHGSVYLDGKCATGLSGKIGGWPSPKKSAMRRDGVN